MKDRESIPFYTEDGDRLDFYVLEQTMIGGINYLLVEEDREDGQDEDLVYIMREAGQDSSEDMNAYTFVEDETELLSVMKVFEQLIDEAEIVQDF